MVILFAPLVKDETLADKLPPESILYLAEIRSYIETRLAPLKKEIETEEANDKNYEVAIMVRFEPSGIKFNGYSKKLVERMNGCFDKDNLARDVQMIWLKFDESVRRLLS